MVGSLLQKRVQIEGLTARTDLNGRVGTAISFEGGRWTIALEGSEGEPTVNVKPANLKLELKTRFKAANREARSLPPEVFDDTMRLKLYALSKQSEGPAPTAPPAADASELDAAKWAAWDCVRHLSKEEAMSRYCEVIDGLVELVQAVLDETGAEGAEAATKEPEAKTAEAVAPNGAGTAATAAEQEEAGAAEA